MIARGRVNEDREKGGKNYKRALRRIGGMLHIFTILIVVRVSQVSKFIKLYTLHKHKWFVVAKCTSMKMCKNTHTHNY